MQRILKLKGCKGPNYRSVIESANPPRIRITFRAKPFCARDHKRAVFQPRPLHHPPHQINGGHEQDKTQRSEVVPKQPSMPARRVLRMRECPADTPKPFPCQKAFASFLQMKQFMQNHGRHGHPPREIKGANSTDLALRHAADTPTICTAGRAQRTQDNAADMGTLHRPSITPESRRATKHWKP